MDSELNFDLIRMSDDELHSFASKKAHEIKTTSDGQIKWANTLLDDGTLEEMFWMMEFQSYDGCSVDVDGTCPHGYKSPMVLLELV